MAVPSGAPSAIRSANGDTVLQAPPGAADNAADVARGNTATAAATHNNTHHNKDVTEQLHGGIFTVAQVNTF